MAYPVFLKLEHKKVVIVGGGRVAERKLKALLEECSNIVVVSGSFTDKIENLANNNDNVTLVKKYFEPKYIEGAFLVFIATNNQDVNNQIADLCVKNDILFNHSADVNQGNVKNGSEIRWGDLHIMIGSGGTRPGVSKWIRTFLEKALPEDMDRVMHLYDDLRGQARDKYTESIDRENYIRDNFYSIIEKVENEKTKKIVLGTRGSQLALTQSQIIADLIEKNHPNIEVELKVIKTKGDIITQRPLDKIGGKGLFVKEIEQQLLDGKIDFAVHSLKDMPSEQPEGLCLICGNKREDARDVLVFSPDLFLDENKSWSCYEEDNYCNMAQIPQNATLGTGAIRRISQLKILRDDLSFKPIRGNIETRIAKIATEGLQGAVLACSGINRLGLDNPSYYTFSYDEIVPAPGQGVLALECREDDIKVLSILKSISDYDTSRSAKLERRFLELVDGGCHTPIGAYAEIQNELVKMYLFYGSKTGNKTYKKTWTGTYDDALIQVEKFAREAKMAVDGVDIEI